MEYPPPGGQYPNDPSAPERTPDSGRPPYAPDRPTITQDDYTGYAPPPPPMPPPQQYGGYAPPPNGPTASYNGYPPSPLPAPSGPMPPYGGYAPPPQYAPPPSYAGQPSQAVYGRQPVIYQPVVYQPQPARGGAVAVEVICGLFGIWGVGWMMSGYTAIGVTLLLVGLLAVPGVAIALIIMTLGFGVVLLPCFWVADIVVIVISAVNLSNRLKMGPPPL